MTSTPPASTPTNGNGGYCSLDEKWKARGGKKLYVGVATDQGLLTNGRNAEVINRNFGQVTPENRYVSFTPYCFLLAVY